jgi:hypothetical protein
MGRRGIALISVLIVLGSLLAIVAAGMQLGSSGVLMVSQTHIRNVALAAAEAGVYEAMMRLDQDKHFEGEGQGTLSESHSSYRYRVVNQLWAGSQATVISTGTYGSVSRTLRVTLEPDTEGFGGVALGGRMYTYDRAYINGISSAGNPLYRPGHAHSEWGHGTEFAFLGGDFDGDGARAQLRATGDLSTSGLFDNSNLSSLARNQNENHSKPQYRLSRDAMLDRSFTNGTVPSDGRFTGNVRLSGDTVFPMKVYIAEGATVHIQGGDAKFMRGIEGKGSLVVDGDLMIQTDSKFDSDNDQGLKVLADGSIAVAHPEASTSDDGLHYEIDAVGDYFAQMPPEAPNQVSHGIPVTAPQDGDFFLWLDEKLSSGGDSEFNLWYNGDGTELNPGLSETTKEWLLRSRDIKEEIKAWADSGH